MNRIGIATVFCACPGYTDGRGGERLPDYLFPMMLINFSVDYLLLLGTAQMAEESVSQKRILTAALLGALYSGSCMFPKFRILSRLPCRIVSLILMCAIGFGLEKESLRKGAVFILLSMALGSTAISAGRGGILPLILSGAVVWILSRFAFGGERMLIPVEIREGDCTVKLLALRDTGNCLRDPVSGDQVLIISREPARVLTGLNYRQLADPVQTMASHPIPGLLLIPYHTVGTDGNLLLGKRFQYVKVGSRLVSGVVAFAPKGLEGKEYQAIAGGRV